MPLPAPRRARRSGFTDKLRFGGMPGVVGALLVAIVTSSLLVAVGSRHTPWFATLLLSPARVLEGEVWSLATWSFLESGPIPLLFGLLAIGWFGSDLARHWGERRFLRIYAAILLSTSVLTCLLGFVDPAVMASTYRGTLPMTEALVVAWGLTYPDAEVRLYFLIPITGRILVYLTVGLTIAFAAYAGWETVLPELVATTLTIAHLRRGAILRRIRPKRPPRKPDLSKVRVKRRGHLWVVTDEDDRRE